MHGRATGHHFTVDNYCPDDSSSVRSCLRKSVKIIQSCFTRSELILTSRLRSVVREHHGHRNCLSEQPGLLLRWHFRCQTMSWPFFRRVLH